uniref:F-box/FBD/LRR-repeat protein At2g04230-like n=1 Tax=Erigeron canadensis TaxID=72917 RepID=UPI001CB8FA78|nr:F-box/FBD/LRR-repeat protein At2g04230-like [Erigeron canadensis]
MASSSYNNGYGDQKRQTGQEDRLSLLPDVLLLDILSYIDTKIVVQCSVLSKRWLTVWTKLSVFNFDFSLYKVNQTYAKDSSFDTFVNNVLACRNKSIKIDSINIKVIDYSTMALVFDHALWFGVPNVSIDTSRNPSGEHKFSCFNYNDSLTNFSLKGPLDFGQLPKFNGLVSLHLERVNLVVSEPFSCFPNLEKLSLVNCRVVSSEIRVIGYRLSKLTISSVCYYPENFLLLTPELVLLELDGPVPMSLKAAFDELPSLESVYIDYSYPLNGFQLDHTLIKTFRCLKNAKHVHLSTSTLKLLYKARDMLAEERCLFWNLKYLNFIPKPNEPVDQQVLESVLAYLCEDSPQAVVDTMHRWLNSTSLTAIVFQCQCVTT